MSSPGTAGGLLTSASNCCLHLPRGMCFICLDVLFLPSDLLSAVRAAPSLLWAAVVRPCLLQELDVLVSLFWLLFQALGGGRSPKLHHTSGYELSIPKGFQGICSPEAVRKRM